MKGGEEMKSLSVVSSVVLAVFLCCCLGDGRALEGWGLAYAALLAMASLVGLYFREEG